MWNANLLFCAAFAVSAWLANLALMRWPPRGRTPSTTIAYLREGSRQRGFACLAGAVCAAGNASQFVGGAWAGFATADLVQAFPLVGTLWGVVLFGEFRKVTAQHRTRLRASPARSPVPARPRRARRRRGRSDP